jgi:uncharacterized linocin/CFP29 family protein
MNDFILNGKAYGDVAKRLQQNNFDIRALRPFIGQDGRTYITVNRNGIIKAMPVWNATATLRKDAWKHLDTSIIATVKQRLKAVADLRSMGLTYTVPNGMGKTVLETETIGDINDASVSMDALRQNANDRPEFELTNLPLPIIHKDFHYSLRQIETSRDSGSPLDTTTAEMAGRKVAEEAEKMLLGVSTIANAYTFGGGTIYGYTNYTNRLTRSITAAAATNGATFIQDLLAMRQQLYNAYYYGPFMVYVSPDWDQYIDDDYKAASDKTIRNRALELNGITDIRTLDYLTTNTILMIQMTSNVVREVIGMDVTTVQWNTEGGLQLNFKVMAILVPQIRADQNSRCGICHGSA